MCRRGSCRIESFIRGGYDAGILFGRSGEFNRCVSSGSSRSGLFVQSGALLFAPAVVEVKWMLVIEEPEVSQQGKAVHGNERDCGHCNRRCNDEGGVEDILGQKGT